MERIRTTSRPQQQQQRRGALTVEFCLVAPIIFMLFLGSLEVTSVNIIRQSASNAAYESARKMVVPGGTADDAREEANRMLQILNVHRGAEIEIEETAERVEVIIQIPAEENSWGLSKYVGGLTITESCVLSRDKF